MDLEPQTAHDVQDGLQKAIRETAREIRGPLLEQIVETEMKLTWAQAQRERRKASQASQKRYELVAYQYELVLDLLGTILSRDIHDQALRLRPESSTAHLRESQKLLAIIDDVTLMRIMEIREKLNESNNYYIAKCPTIATIIMESKDILADLLEEHLDLTRGH